MVVELVKRYYGRSRVGTPTYENFLTLSVPKKSNTFFELILVYKSQEILSKVDIIDFHLILSDSYLVVYPVTLYKIKGNELPGHKKDCIRIKKCDSCVG